MIKEDELKLWKELWIEKNAGNRPYFRAIAKKLGINEKRACYIFMKWGEKGLTECGVSPMAGWIEEGIKEGDLKNKTGDEDNGEM